MSNVKPWMVTRVPNPGIDHGEWTKCSVCSNILFLLPADKRVCAGVWAHRQIDNGHNTVIIRFQMQIHDEVGWTAVGVDGEPAEKVKPCEGTLMTQPDQEVLNAAYKLGGYNAVYDLCGQLRFDEASIKVT